MISAMPPLSLVLRSPSAGGGQCAIVETDADGQPCTTFSLPRYLFDLVLVCTLEGAYRTRGAPGEAGPRCIPLRLCDLDGRLRSLYTTATLKTYASRLRASACGLDVNFSRASAKTRATDEFWLVAPDRIWSLHVDSEPSARKYLESRYKRATRQRRGHRLPLPTRAYDVLASVNELFESVLDKDWLRASHVLATGRLDPRHLNLHLSSPWRNYLMFYARVGRALFFQGTGSKDRAVAELTRYFRTARRTRSILSKVASGSLGEPLRRRYYPDLPHLTAQLLPPNPPLGKQFILYPNAALGTFKVILYRKDTSEPASTSPGGCAP